MQPGDEVMAFVSHALIRGRLVEEPDQSGMAVMEIESLLAMDDITYQVFSDLRLLAVSAVSLEPVGG